MAESFAVDFAVNVVGTLAADVVKKSVAYLRGIHGDSVGQSAALRNLELTINNDLVASKSYTCAFDKIMDGLKDDRVNTIGVWGLGGVGKTTLVTVVGNTVKALKLFHQVIMIVVSQTPDVGKIQQKIADFINLKFQKETKEAKAGELWDRLEKEEKVLIILDDMWEELKLKEIGIPLRTNGKGCKIILTTRRKPICESMAGQVQVPLGVSDMARHVTVPLGVLGEDDAWTLFKKKANLDEDTADVETINVAKEVAKRCKGLPVAVITLASALKGANTVEEWEMAQKKLESNRFMEIGNIEEEEKNAYMCLETSYEQLKKGTTKKLFLLCAVYPEDQLINPEELVRYAWGLNIYRNAASIQEVRVDVLAAIKNLKDSCLLLEDIQERSESPLTWYEYHDNMYKTSYIKMHDVIRDVARWIASKEDNGFVADIGVGPKNEIAKQKLEILVLDNYDDSKTPIDYFKGMPRLKVLSLSAAWTNLDVFSLNALEPLTDLRVLQLIDFVRLEGFSALSKLKKLEILCLSGSRFQESIEKLGELTNLRVLDMRECKFLLGFPPNLIRRLVKTKELYLYGSEIEQISTAILSELHFLPKLDSLSLRIPPLHFPQDFVFPRLQRYQIAMSPILWKDPHISSRFLMIYEGGLNVISELLWNVEFLEVSKIKEKYIKWLTDATSGKVALAVKILQNLKLVSIIGCENLQVIFQMEKTEIHALLLSKLKALRLQWLPNLEYIWKMPTQHVRLHSLEAVHLNKCGKLKSVFSFSLAQCLIHLQLLEIEHCDELKKIVEEVEGDEQEISVLAKSLCLPNLRTLNIWDCKRLEYIFPNFMAFQGLPQLQKLLMDRLPQLKQICKPAMQREENSFLQSQLQELFPSLTELTLRDCPEMIDAMVIPKVAHLEGVQLSKLRNALFTNTKNLSLNGINGDHNLIPENKGNVPNLKVDANWEENRAQPLSNLEHYFSLQNLKVVNIFRCRNLKYLFSPSLIQSLRQLEKLQIEDCAELKTLFAELESVGETESNSHLHPLCLPRLTTLNITRCERLEYILPITLAQGGLPQLEQLLIEDCAESKTLFAELESVGETESNSHLHPLCLPRLTTLNITRCERLEYVLPITLAQGGLPQLEQLLIEDCAELKTLFAELESVGETESNSRLHPLCLPRLTTLIKFRCERLEYVLPITLAQGGLPQLEQLLIEDCAELKTLFAELESVGETESNSHLHSLCLPRLTTLYISKCERLEYVFPITLAQGLPLLESAKVGECPQLEQLFGGVEKEYDGVEKCIKLPHLRDSQLCELTNWSSFGPRNYLVKVPTLKKLSLYATPQLTKFTIQQVDNQWVNLEKTLILGVDMEQLTSLKLKDFKDLECLADTAEEKEPTSGMFTNLVMQNMTGEPPKGFLQNWEVLKVEECMDIVSVYPMAQNIKKLVVKDCRKLQEAFLIDKLSRVENQAQLLSDLDSLELESLPELRWILKGPTQYVSLHNLKVVIIQECNKLEFLFSFSLILSLRLLEKLWIIDCDSLEMVFSELESEGESEPNKLLTSAQSLPRLQELHLRGLKNMSSFGPENYFITLLALEDLEVVDCPHLTNFSIQQDKALQSKPKLLDEYNSKSSIETIELGGLVWLQEIWRCHIPVVALTNLRELEVYNCNSLTYIFPLIHFRNLPQLWSLEIRRCEKVEQIIGDDDTSASSSQGDDQLDETTAVKNEKQVVIFSKLKVLKLKLLPNLVSFNPLSYHLIFSSLFSLKIQGCPQMITNFTVDSISLVHAQTKAVKAAPLDGTTPSTPDITWFSYEPTSLPPYVEEADET